MSIGVFLFAAAVALEVRLNLMRQKQGGCHDMHETVVIVREAPTEWSDIPAILLR
jgi:hypothetical protein